MPRPSAAAGRSGSWTGRSARSSSSAPATPSARQSCCARQRRRPADAINLQNQMRDPYSGVPRPQGRVQRDRPGGAPSSATSSRSCWNSARASRSSPGRSASAIGDEWYRIDLLLYHRPLRCLVVVDLKLGRFTHADAGQMNLYLNYTREHHVEPGGARAGRPDPVQREERRRRPLRDGRDQGEVFASRY